MEEWEKRKEGLGTHAKKKVSLDERSSEKGELDKDPF